MKTKRLLPPFPILAILLLPASCTSQSREKTQKPGTKLETKNEAEPCSRHYKFDGTWYDLETCKPADLGGKALDFKDCSPYGDQFRSPLEDTVEYKGKTFFVTKKYDLVISAQTSAVPKRIKMPVPNPLPEVHEYYFTLLPAPDGVVVIMEDYYGTDFTVLKYDVKGNEIARTSFEHTFITHPEPNTNYMHRYLYLGYTTPTQLVFTSHMAFGEKDKTIVVELKDLSKKEYDYKIAGIVKDENQQKVKGFIINNSKGHFTVKFPGTGKQTDFTIEYGDGACTVVLKGNRLVVANYHPISTGSSLYCFDASTGKKIWKADVAQVNASHSEYYNTVYLSLYKNKIVMEGQEAYGNYLQLFDLDSGKRLACFGIPEVINK